MNNESNRNTIVFIICAVVILIGYQMFVLEPQTKRKQAELRAQQAAAASTAQPGQAPAIAGGSTTIAPLKPTREAARAASPRVPVATPSLTGSISLRGARIDDLFMNRYRLTVDPKSPPVELLRPEGAEHAWFADFGWAGANVPGLPGPQTVWTLSQGATLAPNRPITLTYDNGQGLVFTRNIAVDDKFMFTVTDQVRNAGGQAVTLAPYASVQRQGIPADLGKTQIVHEGAIGVFDGKLQQEKYKEWKKEAATPKTFDSTGGWVGITDKFWLAALIPANGEKVKTQFRVTEAGGVDVYDTNFVGPTQPIAPGATVTQTTRLFAGAKTVPLLKDYAKTQGVDRLDDAVDWGMFWFFTRPIFLLLDFFFQHVGNFGVAILLLTVTVKLLFFPLANKSYESMSKMKKLSGPMEELRAKYKDDPAKQQQEIMALYQREKVNPFMGCLPLLIQIPVFYSLYKVLTVTIEMRHAPFFGWIQDLSSRDPISIWNLFGLIPYDPASIPLLGSFLNGPLHLGPWVILYGASMWLTTAMNPPAPDPTQQRIFQLMPIMFTFIMAPFAVGLIIYWTWNNVLSILQQYVIMHRLKVDNPIDNIIARLTGKKAAT
ncbi:MAG: membrane protein insertase YidC [Caulobacterales bacterium]|nr:membrane protein insertase YidC [Caulobacterales bacterium]